MKEDVKRLIKLTKIEDDHVSKAKHLRELNKVHDVRIIDLAKEFGTSSTHICNLIRLTKLPELILDGYYADMITYTHLLLLSRLHEESDMVRLYEKILAGNMPTPRLEEEVRIVLYDTRSIGEKLDIEDTKRVEKVFTDLDEDASVKVVQTRLRTKVIIEKKGTMKDTTDFLKKIAHLKG